MRGGFSTATIRLIIFTLVATLAAVVGIVAIVLVFDFVMMERSEIRIEDVDPAPKKFSRGKPAKFTGDTFSLAMQQGELHRRKMSIL